MKTIENLKLKICNLQLPIRVLFACFALFAVNLRAQPTNKIVPNDLTVMTDTNGVLLAPANLFIANGTALRGALASTYIPVSGGSGTNLNVVSNLTVSGAGGNITIDSVGHVIVASVAASALTNNGTYLQIFANTLVQQLQAIWTNTATGSYFGISTNAVAHSYRAAVGANISAGLILSNLTASATNAPQNSPAVVQYANIWEGASGNVPVGFASQVAGIQNSGSAAQPAGVWNLYGTTNGFVTSNRVFSVDHAGNATNLNNLTVGAGLTVAGVTNSGLSTNSGAAGFGSTVVIAGTINRYNGSALLGNGVPSLVASVDLINQSAAISSTPMWTNGAAKGRYLMMVYAETTTAGSGGTITIENPFMNGNGSSHSAGNNVLGITSGSTVSSPVYFWVAATSVINYATVFNSVTGSPIYTVHWDLFQL